MLNVLLFHLATLLCFPLNLALGARAAIGAPKGTSFVMRYILFNLRLRQNKLLRSMRWAQPAVNRINAKLSAEYCTCFPRPPKNVNVRKVQINTPSLFSSTLASSPHPWSFFLISPVRPFPSKRPLILYSHGGSFVTTLHELHFTYLYELCQRTGGTILVHDYPRPPAGANHEETFSVLTELVSSLCSPSSALHTESPTTTLTTDENQLAQAARNRTKLVFMGDSAGGSISLALCFKLIDSDLEDFLPDEAILIAPGIDGRMTDAELCDGEDPWLALAPCYTVIDAWKGPNQSLTHYLVSPGLASDDLLRSLLNSKTRVTNFHGTADILYPPSVTFHKRVAQVAKESGINKISEKVRFISAAGMPHVWPLIPPLAPEIREARTTIVSLINSSDSN
ncbi:hypothetical protein CF327_g7705 [Tilletia walkeri]|nr:hypothetical protein CF327_g7705 [Tilletia walkeri]